MMDFSKLDRAILDLCRGEDPVEREKSVEVLKHVAQLMARRIRENLVLAFDCNGKCVVQTVSTPALIELISNPQFEQAVRSHLGRRYSQMERFETPSGYHVFAHIYEDQS